MTSEIVATGTYVLLVVLWAAIIALYVRARREVADDQLIRGLLAVLMLDAVKNLVESAYFGLTWAANYGLISESLRVLGRGDLLTAAKLGNVVVAVVILAWLIRRWIPRELEARRAHRAEEARLREELERSLAATKLSEERFRLAATASRDIVWDWDLRTDACVTSPRIAELLGVAPEAWPMTMAPWVQHLHPDDAARVQQHARDFIDGRIPAYDIRYRMVGASGQVLTMSATALVIRDETGRPVRLVGQTRDLTADLEAEQARLATQKLEGIGLLAGGVAHDFNNLLAVISTSLAAAKLDGAIARDAMETAQAAVARASTLTRQLLSYAGKGESKRRPVDLAVLVREMRELLSVSVPRSVRLTLELADDAPPVIGDEAQLQQVVMNLLTNAAEAIGPREGAVTLRVRCAREDARPVVVLEVEDTGDGMTDEVRARLFDPFFSTKGHGRGLGLAVMAGILKAHGAFVAIESALGKGSRFTVTFTELADAAPIVDAPEPAPAATPVGLRVLLVDDEALVRRSVRWLLESRGWIVTEAGSGDEAVERFRSDPIAFDVVLMDVTMPGLSGVEAARAMLGLRPGAPIVLISGYTQTRAMAAGLPPTVELLGKPFENDELERALRDAVVRGGASR